MSNQSDMPAFPISFDQNEVAYGGMTMRQYYKAVALNQMLDVGESSPRKIAELCGEIADSMLYEDENHEKRNNNE